MGIKFGEIDTAQIIDNEYRAKVIEELVKLIIGKNNLQGPTEEEMEEIKDKVIEGLKKRYPNSGVKRVT